MSYDPNDWQTLLPDHAADVREALEDLLLILGRVKADTNDSTLEAAAARWCIAEIEAWTTADAGPDGSGD